MKSRTPMVMLTEDLMREWRERVALAGSPAQWIQGLSDKEIDSTYDQAGCTGNVPTEVRTWYRFFNGLSKPTGNYVDILYIAYNSLASAFNDRDMYNYDPFDPRPHCISLNYTKPWFWVDQHGVPGQPSVVLGQFDNTDGPEDLEPLWPSFGAMVTDMIEALKIRRYSNRNIYWWEGRSVLGVSTMWDHVLGDDLPDDPKWLDPEYDRE